MKALSIGGLSALAVLSACSGHEEASGTADVSYPHVMEDGALACGDGEAMGRNVEYYYLDKINARLNADQELSEFARDRGIEKVTSCESARAFNEIDSALRDARFKAGALPPSDGSDERGREIVDDATELDPALPAPESVPDDTEVDKIADGVSSNFSFPVNLQKRDSSGVLVTFCSGVLVNGEWLLSAAHCFSKGGTQALTVKNKNGTIISSGDHWVTRHPEWDGGVGDGDDLALVRAPSKWGAPNNVPSSWRPIFGRRLYSNSRVNIYGYGPTNNAGAGLDNVLRTNTYQIRVDWDSSGFIGMHRVLGEGAPCKGDSGGPAILLNEDYPLIVGVASYYIGGGVRCPGEGDTYYYTQVGGGPGDECKDGTKSTSHSCWIQDTIGNDICKRRSVASDHPYTYLQCYPG